MVEHWSLLRRGHHARLLGAIKSAYINYYGGEAHGLPKTSMKLLAGKASCCVRTMPCSFAAFSTSLTSFSPHFGAFAARSSRSKASLDGAV